MPVAHWSCVASFIPTLSTIGDPDGARTVTSIVALLVAMGIALLLLAVWIFRSTRTDPELLAPLEVMGERSWRRKDPVWQRRRLDELRPPGAKPLDPSVAPPEIDEAFEAGPVASGFDDLHGHETAPEDAGAVPEPDVAAHVDAEPPPDATPSGMGLTWEDLSDDEFDPDALAAAREEIERELAESRSPSVHEQLDLFHGDDRDRDDRVDPR